MVSFIKKNTDTVVVAIVVTFEPNVSGLLSLLDSISEQVQTVVIVDNSIACDLCPLLPQSDQVTYKKLPDNYGIAYAQNFGIEVAIQYQPTHILLLDQDSEPASDMVKQLHCSLEQVTNAIAAGPSYIDKRSGRQSFFVMDRFGIPFRLKAAESANQPFVHAAFLIASGTLIDAAMLIKVNGMRSHYFIDHVDTEWSLRVRQHGYEVIGVPTAIMRHSLGDEVKSIWFFGKRQVSYHSPLRDYYMFRNTLLMLKDLRLSIFWQLHLIWRLMQFATYFLLFAPQRRKRVRLMWLGLWHGLQGRAGKLDIDTGQCSTLPTSVFDPEKLY